MKTIEVDALESALQEEESVKIAILDSGIDWTDNINVVERQNFIENDPVTTPLYEDTCGHGTSIASIIAGKGLDDNVRGVNPNALIYSARVLDENKQAPISRIIQAIEWAVDKDVDIINMSFGCEDYSPALKAAIDNACDKGILIVAAAGNESSNTANYPAADERVLGVTSISPDGNLSDFSNYGEGIDIAAPGESISVQGNFGEEIVATGTSLSAAHTTGVASLLLSKDTTKSPTFISMVMKASARVIPDVESFGLLDCERALELYEQVKENVDTIHDAESELVYHYVDDVISADADEEIQDYSEENVNGNWKATVHEANITNAAMKKGAKYPDYKSSGIRGMSKNPDFHGFSWRDPDNEYYGKKGYGVVNYMANYRYLVKIAFAYGDGNTYTDAADNLKGLTSDSKTAIKNAFENNIVSYMKNQGYTAAQKKAFVMGIAMHNAMDAFAHSTFKQSPNIGSWYRITHPEADSVAFCSDRHDFALQVQKNVINRYKGNRSGIHICHDFHDPDRSVYTTSVNFRLNKMKTFAEKAGVTNENILTDYGIID